MNPAAFSSLPSDACALGVQGSQGPDRVTKNSYDLAGQLLQIRKAVGVAGTEQVYVTYTWTLNGKQQDVTDANGNHALLTYDAYDRQKGWAFPSKTVTGVVASCNVTSESEIGGIYGPPEARNATDDCEKYLYDRNNNRVKLVKRDGTVLSFTVDALNRVTVKGVPDDPLNVLLATHTRDVYYAYDLLGRQRDARFDSPTGEGVHNDYDAAGRLTATSLTMDGSSRQVGYLYDRDGDRTRVTFPDGNYVAYGYDGLDRPSLIQRSGTSTIASYGYEPQTGWRTSFGGGINTSYIYDPIGRLQALTNNPAANAGYNNQYTLSYNPASQITTRSGSNDQFAWVGATSASLTYTPNGLNQYSAVNSNGTNYTYSYDGNGNLTADGLNTYLYDRENRLVKVSGGKIATLRYDPLGRLYEVTGSTATTRFLMGGDELLAEYDTTGNLLRRYVHGAEGAADDPIAWYEGPTFTGTSERVMRPNWQGSIALVTDNAGSAIFARNTYDEYGYPGTANGGRFQYTGQAWLAEAGLYYYKARMYSPILGRFMQTDPIGYDDQINLYAYVANDPLNKTDPTGEFGIVGFAIGAAVETAVQVGTNMASGQDFGEALSNVDVGDVLIAGAVSAVIPGVGNAIKTGVTSTRIVVRSVKATNALAQQSARTTNRATKLAQRIASHADKIKAARGDVARASGTAAVHQFVKKTVQERTPPVTPASASSNSPSNSAPTPPPPPPCNTGDGCSR